MAMKTRLLTAILLLLAFAAPASGQWLQDRTVPKSTPGAAPVQLHPSALLVGAGGVAGGVIGALPGIFVIHHAAGWEGLGYGIVAAYAGYSLAMPLGAHLANRRGGKLWANVLTSVGVAAAGLGVLEATGEDALYIAVPIAQLAAAVAMERAFTR